jgi:hypothetical protein
MKRKKKIPHCKYKWECRRQGGNVKHQCFKAIYKNGLCVDHYYDSLKLAILKKVKSRCHTKEVYEYWKSWNVEDLVLEEVKIRLWKCRRDLKYMRDTRQSNTPEYLISQTIAKGLYDVEKIVEKIEGMRKQYHEYEPPNNPIVVNPSKDYKPPRNSVVMQLPKIREDQWLIVSNVDYKYSDWDDVLTRWRRNLDKPNYIHLAWNVYTKGCIRKNQNNKDWSYTW